MGDSTVTPISCDIGKCDKRLRFYMQRRLLWNFTACFSCSWATHELLHALLCVLLMEVVIATPWGVKYGRHSRIALSGAYIVQAMESWVSTLLVMRTSLDVALNSPERCWPIRRFGVLADDIFIHVLKLYLERYRKAIILNAAYLDYQIKDEIVTAGSPQCFTWLGYEIIGGVARLDEMKLLVTLLIPERFPVLFKHVFKRPNGIPIVPQHAHIAQTKTLENIDCFIALLFRI